MTNRAARRAAIANSKRAARHGAWGEWEEIPLTDEMRRHYHLPSLQRAWRNAVYSVQQFPNATADGEVTLLMVRRHDAAPVRSWSDMQRIKNDLAGEDRVAVEVYPREEDLVDQANMYHLWVLPVGHGLSFGLHLRDAMRSPPDSEQRLAAITREDEQTRRTRKVHEAESRELSRLGMSHIDRAERAEAALADVRQRCGGYPDSRVDGDGGIVAVVVRERDDARRSITCARYCLENDHGEAAVRACLDGMGMAPGIAEEYQSDLDRVTLERNAAVAEKDRADAAVCRAMTERDEAQADLSKVRVTRDACLATAEEATRQTEEAIRQRDEAQAALVGLREACRKPLRVLDKLDVEEWADFDDTLAATPATLAGQVRARVLRDIADSLDAEAAMPNDGNVHTLRHVMFWERMTPIEGRVVAAWLRALADEAEETR